MKRFIIVSIVCLLLAGLLGAVPFAAAGKAEEKEELLPCTDYLKGVSAYDKPYTLYATEQETEKAGFSAGFSGKVLATTGNQYAGVTFDYSPYKIPITSVKSITFRVFLHAKAKEVRLTRDGGTTWLLRETAFESFQWNDVAYGLASGEDLTALANEDGQLGAFQLAFRFQDNATDTAYIDAITLELREPDTEPPEIRYTGTPTPSVTAGKPFLLKGLSAYDDYDAKEITPEFRWEDGALDEDGNMKEGTYACTVLARDCTGNESKLELTVTVRPKDTEPPRIPLADSGELILPVGILPQFDEVPAIDNEDDVTAAAVWSKGALDLAGKLTEGTHELTLTAEDRSGNRTEKTITVRAEANPQEPQTVRDESQIDFGKPYKIFCAVLLLVTAALVAVALLIRPRQKKA